MNASEPTGARSIVGRLILKDLHLYRGLIAGALISGVVSLVLSHLTGGDHDTTGTNVGFLLFLTTIIAYGVAIPMVGILKERQNRSQLFVLSLPVSPGQYSIAKVLAALAAFLLPWITFTAGVVATIVLSGAPRGGIPFFVAMMSFFLSNFCLLMALVAVTQSEIWTTAGILVTNVSVTVFLIQVGRLVDIGARSKESSATWSPAIAAILGAEVAIVALSLGLAFYIPSRRKDFV